MVDGGLHAAQLGRLYVQHLEHIVGESIDQIRNTGQRLSGVAFGFFKSSVLIWRLERREEEKVFISAQMDGWR